MEDRAQGRTPFDERAALEELDRLREQIEHYKAQRKAVEAEFDRFIGSFKTPRESAAVNRLPDEASASATRGASPPTPPASIPRPEWSKPQSVAPHAPAGRAEEPRSAAVEPLVAAPQPVRSMPEPVAPTPEARRVPPEPPRAAPDTIAPIPEPAPALPEAMGPAPEAPPALSESPGVASQPSRDWPEPFLSPSDPVLLPSAEPVTTPSALPVVASPPAASSSTRMLLPGALILLVGGGLLTWSLRKGAPESTAPQLPQPVSAPASPAPEPPPPAAPQPQPQPYESELTTTRAVWLRIIADGERIVEREVPAGTRVPFEARKSIVIRTGDAGAVRLSIGGQDQGFLGREGEVTTRTFTVPDTGAR
jgi:Domain of unknown function (DUF4115)